MNIHQTARENGVNAALKTTICCLLLAAGCLPAGCYQEQSAQSGYAPKVYAVERHAIAVEAYRKEKYREALEAATEAANHDPGYADAAKLRALILLRTDKTDLAADALASYCEQWPDDAEGQSLHGLSLERMGRTEAATAAYGRAVGGFDKMLAEGTRTPEKELGRALLIYLRDGRSAGLVALNQVLSAYPDYGPAREIKQNILDNNRGFVLDWLESRPR